MSQDDAENEMMHHMFNLMKRQEGNGNGHGHGKAKARQEGNARQNATAITDDNANMLLHNGDTMTKRKYLPYQTQQHTTKNRT